LHRCNIQIVPPYYKEINISHIGGKYPTVCEILTVDYRFKKKLLSTEMDFWRSPARTSKTLKVRNEVIREQNGSNTNSFVNNGK
jgi:hypothetical protein